MRKLSSNCCPSSVDRCDGMTEETESCMLESAVHGHHVYKTTWSPAIGQVLQVGAEDSNAYGTCACAHEIIRGVWLSLATLIMRIFFCEVLFTRKFAKI